MAPRLTEHEDLFGNVRNDGRFHSIRNLVRPWDPDVVELAHILHQSPDFVEAAHAFVHKFTTYAEEPGDIWRTPAESMDQKLIDCDDSAILLVSLLRNYMGPDQVFCAAGMWKKPGGGGGHMWVEVASPTGGHKIVESTAESTKVPWGKYETSVLFNDQYTFATPRGLTLFGLLPSEDIVRSLVDAGALPAWA